MQDSWRTYLAGTTFTADDAGLVDVADGNVAVGGLGSGEDVRRHVSHELAAILLNVFL
jgi:hypothetical protein